MPAYTLLPNEDYQGNDISGGCGTTTSTMDDCARLCARTPYCKVFMYRDAGCNVGCCQGCWLKSEFPVSNVGIRYDPAAKVTTGAMPGES